MARSGGDEAATGLPFAIVVPGLLRPNALPGTAFRQWVSGGWLSELTDVRFGCGGHAIRIDQCGQMRDNR